MERVPPLTESERAETLSLASLRGRARVALTSSFTREVAEMLGTRVLLMGVAMLSGVIVARALGPEGRGYYAAAIALAGLGVQLGNLGLHSSNTYNVSRDRALLPRLFANSLVASFGVAGVGSLVAILVFATWPSVAPVWGWVMVLSLVGVPFSLAYLLHQSLLLGLREVRAYNRIDATTACLTLALVGAVILLGRASVPALLLCTLTGSVVAFGWSAARLVRQMPELHGPSWELFGSTLRYGSKAYVAAIFAFVAQRVDLLLVQRMLGSASNGYYSVAVSVAGLMGIFPSVVGTLLFPRLAAMPTREARWSVAIRMIGLVAAAMCLASAVLGMAAPILIRILFGEDFAASADPLLWLLPGIVAMSLNSIIMNYFAADGLPRFAVYAWGVAALADVLLNFRLIPLYGIEGAAMSASLSSTLLFAISFAWAYSTNRPAQADVAGGGEAGR